MAFTLRSLTELTDFARALGRALLPTRDWSPFSTGGKWAVWFASGTAEVLSFVKSAMDDLTPLKAAEKTGGLAMWGEATARPRKPATGARKSSALRVHGTVGAAITIGDQLESAGGLVYQITENEVIPAAGSVVVDVAAISTGSQTRLTAGTVLTFVSTPPGLIDDAELVLDLDEDGTDEESVGAWRTRIVGKFQDPPHGGARSDFEGWCTEVTGIETAYVYPHRKGLGTVDIAALHAGSGSARLLTGGEISDLQTHLEERIPVDMADADGNNVRVLTVVAQEVDIDVRITSNGMTQYGWDWDDTVAPVVDSWIAGNRQLVFPAGTRPPDLKAGDRIIFKTVAGNGTGQQYVVESLTGVDDCILEEAPVPAPVAGDTVYAGGALVDPVRDAIVAHLNSLGPTNPDASPYGPWEGNVRPEKIDGIATAVAGVKKVDVVTPAATIEPADNPYPNDGTVYLAVPGQVVVRRAH